MAFSCCCCGNGTCVAAGSYSLTTRSDSTLFDGPHGLSCPLVSCTNCSHVMVHPVPADEEIRQYYRGDFWLNRGAPNEFRNRSWRQILISNGGLWERSERARLQLEFLLDHVDLPTSAKILDLGSGLAPFLYHCWKREFTNLYALEPSEEICRFLDRQGIVTYPTLAETFVVREDPLRFDVIVLSHVVEHLLKPDEVLTALKRLLTESGVLLLETPYQDHLSPHPRGLHLHFFNERSMAQLLTTCGYRVVVVQPKPLNLFEAALIRVLHAIHGRAFLKQRGTVRSLLESPWVNVLHRFGLRPLKRLLRLKINIFIESQDLVALATR